MSEELLYNYAEWPAKRDEIERRLKKFGADQHLRTLVERGCNRESLLMRLAGLAACWRPGKAYMWSQRLPRYQVKAAPRKLRRIADLLDELQEHRFLLPAESNISTQALRETAKILEDKLPVYLKPIRLTLAVETLCGLIGYVRLTSRDGMYHDEEVSGLIAAVLGKDKYFATHLTQWRSKHREELVLAETFVANPFFEPDHRR